MKDKVCTCCGKKKALSNFYYSSSYVNKNTETVQICKDCIFSYVDSNDKNEELNKIKEILRMIDKPFIESMWNKSKEEAEKRNRDTFGTYMKNVAMPHSRDKTWKDSQFKEDIVVVKKEEVPLENDTITDEQLREMTKTWGIGSDEGYSIEDYLYMQDFYDKYMAKFPNNSPAQVNTYKTLAKIHLKAEKKLENDEIKEWKELMDVSSKLHNDAKIKAVQTGGIGEDKGLHCYGLWVADVENDEPAEHFEKKPLYKDYDGLGKDWARFILRPLKNIFTNERDFNVGDD